MDLTTTTQLGGLYRAVKEIADGTSPDLTLRQVLVLLDVAGRTMPAGQQELADKHDAYKSTMSKIIANLSGSTGTVKRAGMGMLLVDLDPADMRGRLVSLSKDGERLLTRACRKLIAP